MVIPLAILFIFLGCYLGLKNSAPKNNFSSSYEVNRKSSLNEFSKKSFPRAESKIKLSFVGDIMLARNIGKKLRKEDDFDFIFDKIKANLKESDFLFGNLESVISNKGRNIGSKYSFRADPRSIEALSEGQFDLVSVANNHSADWTGKAFLDSIERLKNEGISPCGGGEDRSEALSPVIKKVKGVKIATICATNIGPKLFKAEKDSPGFFWLEKQKLRSKIARLRKEKRADLIVTSLHFGREYKKQPSTVQINLAKSSIEAGADLVIGHHPHVSQPVRVYKGGIVAYSLGNFVFDQLFSKQTRESFILNVYLNDEGNLSGFEKRRIRINDNYQPTLLKEKGAFED